MFTLEPRNARVALQETKTYRVLLVSQKELIAFSLVNFFADSDITIVTAAKTADGVGYLEHDKFDAVIANISREPDESFRLRAEIRKTDERIPILFMTPQFFSSDVRMLDKIAEDTCSYYIPENADRKFLLTKLHQVIQSSQAEHSLNLLKHKIDRNLFLAGLLQQAMLPPWVYFSKNYEFSCLYRPFTTVSGNLFQWLPLDEDRVLFIFGDVSGHGTHSALAMTAIQSFLSQAVMRDQERAVQPDLIAADINNFFCQHLHNIVYMSSLIAYMDFRNNFIRYLNAGYMDIVSINAGTGEFEELNPEKKGSIPLGMVKDAVYTETDNVEYHFSDSSVFLFCSDGLMDLSKDRDGEKNMEMEKFRQLASILVKDPQMMEMSVSLPFRCLHSLEQFGYAFQQDDLSMVLVRKKLPREREYVFSFRAPADKKAVDRICEKASSFVSGYYEDVELSVCTELLLEEYLVNVIMHGLGEYERLNEYIAVKLCAYDKELKLIIWDHGKEWNGLDMKPENADKSLEQLNENMSTSGRGIPIMSKIASRISRQRCCGLNETVFYIPKKTSSNT